jgi:rfaE bifunctional protein nucleotidyltransferase chain/domain
VVPLDHTGPTRTKTRLLSTRGHPLLRVDHGGPGSPAQDLSAEAREAIEGSDAVLVSDYGAGTTEHPGVRRLLTEVAGSPHTKLVWDPHPRGGTPVPGADLVTPNLAEAAGAVGEPVARGKGGPAGASLGEQLRRLWQARSLAVTAAEHGAWLATGAEAVLFMPTTPVAGDPCGAGDQFAASAVRELVRGRLVSEAVEQAVVEATAWVAAGGAADYRRCLGAGRRWSGPSAVPPPPGRDVRRSQTLVATGGCFDVLHAGHVATLEAARRLGDRLVVLLNSDASVRRLKGKGRPVHSAADRTAVLRALAAVDEVVVFDEDDPREALSRLRPDVWAKGGDYDADALVESELVLGWGGRVVLLPYLPGRSTTAVLEGAR